MLSGNLDFSETDWAFLSDRDFRINYGQQSLRMIVGGEVRSPKTWEWAFYFSLAIEKQH